MYISPPPLSQILTTGTGREDIEAHRQPSTRSRSVYLSHYPGPSAVRLSLDPQGDERRPAVLLYPIVRLCVLSSWIESRVFRVIA